MSLNARTLETRDKGCDLSRPPYARVRLEAARPSLFLLYAIPPPVYLIEGTKRQLSSWLLSMRPIQPGRLVFGGKMTRSDRSIWAVPEITVAFLSFFLHFVWEFLQVPFFAGLPTSEHWPAIKVCTRATIGDVGFALIAFWTTAAFSRSRRWITMSSGRELAVFLTVGLVLTVVAEFHATEVAGRWSYADAMPTLPVLGTGLTPLLQWIVVPLLVVSLGRRTIAPPCTSTRRCGREQDHV